MSERMVWLNVESGKFSQSWCPKKYPNPPKATKHWKLIKYEVLDGGAFEFSDHMRLR